MTNEEMTAKIEDMQEQLAYLFKLHGPATWARIQKQRRDNAPKPLPSIQHQSHGVPNKPLAN